MDEPCCCSSISSLLTVGRLLTFELLFASVRGSIPDDDANHPGKWFSFKESLTVPVVVERDKGPGRTGSGVKVPCAERLVADTEDHCFFLVSSVCFKVCLFPTKWAKADV